MEKNRHALDMGGGRDVKIGIESGLESFQAQPKCSSPRLVDSESPSVMIDDERMIHEKEASGV